VSYTATGPVSIRWVKDGDALPNLNDRANVSMGCVAGEPTFITVTITDPDVPNDPASGTRNVRCPGVPR
jgi:hypothetical protein